MLVNIHIRTRLLILALHLAPLQTALSQSSHPRVWSLQQCLDTARTYNKNLLISENNLSISEERIREAQAGLMPKINLNADYRFYTNLPYQLMPMSVFGGPEGQYKEAQFGVPHNLNANVQITMPFYNPQLSGAIRTTRIASEVSELQKQKTEEQIYFEISNAYYNAQILNSQKAFVNHNLENTNKLLATLKLLKEQLLARGTDVNKVALEAEQLTTKMELLNSQYELVLNSLKFLMGIPLETAVYIEPTIDHKDQEEYEDQLSTDIRLVQTQKRLIGSETSTLKNSRLPVVSLFGTFGTTGFGYDKSPNDFFDFYPIGFAGVQFTYPLFNGMATKRKIQQKNFELSNSELQMDLLVQQTRMQIENARNQQKVAKRTMENTVSQMKLAQSIYDLTLLQQKQGTATLTDILMADNALQEAQQAYLSSVIDYLKANLELKKQTGNILKK
jgi:OMF family outer membrane factor